jgi:hypothetical protein
MPLLSEDLDPDAGIELAKRLAAMVPARPLPTMTAFT